FRPLDPVRDREPRRHEREESGGGECQRALHPVLLLECLHTEDSRPRAWPAFPLRKVDVKRAAQRPSARAITAMCSGVEPQHTPTMRAPRSTYADTCSASISGSAS